MPIKINKVKATNMELTPAISDYVEKKIGMLEKHVDLDDTSVSVDIEIGKTTEHHQKGEIFRAEFNFMKGGEMYRAEDTAEDLYAAIDGAKDDLERRIRRTDEKKQTMRQRGNRAVKNIVRGFKKFPWRK